MNVRISGSGVIPAGEYDNISVSGSSRMSGVVKCSSLSASGSLRGESLDCTGKIKTSGSTSLAGNVRANSISASGTFKCGRDVFATDSISTSGTFKCGGSVKCNKLSVSGSVSVNAGIEAERVESSGMLRCGGLINAEQVHVKSCDKLEAASIGGTTVVIKLSKFKRFFKRIPIISGAVKNARVANSIEADEVNIEYVNCPKVMGRVVKIGRGCRIDSVEYSEKIEISNSASVGKTEKI